jgi:hypothetical protein
MLKVSKTPDEKESAIIFRVDSEQSEFEIITDFYLKKNAENTFQF